MRKKENRLFNMVLLGLLLGVLTWNGCSKDNVPLAGENDGTILEGAVSANAVLSGNTYTLDLKAAKSEGGYAYKLSSAVNVSGDSNSDKTKSPLRLFENGIELTSAHAVHEDIRKQGKGRFSHWGTTLYFSASDNSNPLTNGRKYTYTLDGSTPKDITTPEDVVKPPAQDNGSATVNKNGLIGYAMVNGSTTGGQGGSVVTVSTLSGFKSAVAESSAKIIYVSGTIKGSGGEPVYVKSNKTIMGKPGAVIEGVSLYLFTVNNIIIQDITFKNYVKDAAVMIKYQSTHIWIDHCDFSTDRTHGWDYWGKDISITRGSDFVTVSWNKFHDTNLSVLISGGTDASNVADDKGKLHVTMHHNHWYNVAEREPSMNTGNVHLFNNYHQNNSGYSVGARASGIVRVDNEYFENCKLPLSTQVASDPAGYIGGSKTCVFVNSGSNKLTTAESNWLPPYSYNVNLDPAANVAAIVKAGAGPRAIN